VDATAASSCTSSSSIVEESETLLLLFLRIRGDSDSELDLDLDLRDGTTKGACVGGEARYISRFHRESWGTSSPNVRVDVSRCRVTLSQDLRGFQPPETTTTKLRTSPVFWVRAAL
jgi:hypothetical protein